MATTEEGIYYPDDYTKNADVPDDMKKMAESVDVILKNKVNKIEGKGLSTEDYTTEEKSKLAGLTNYNDTAIKKEIQELDDNQIHITTEKANNINIKDASGQNAKIKLFGVSKQKIREGYNLLNIASKFEVTGRSNAIAISLKTGVTYTVKADNIETNNENPTTLAISFRTASDVIVRDLAFSYNSKKATFQVTKEVAKVYIYSADNYNNSQNITTTYTNLMIYEGTDDKEYEAYGASPSPKFPSKIENTTGNVEITDCNKNFLNVESEYEVTLRKTVQITLTAGNYIVKADDIITSDENTTEFDFSFRDTTGEISNIRISKSIKKTTFKLNRKATYVNIYASYDYNSSTGVTTTYKNLMICKETNDDSYIAHEEQLMTFPLQKNQKMMEGSRTENDGIHHKRKQITLTGNEQIVKYTKTFPNGYGYRVVLNDVKANTEVLSSIYNYEKFSNFYWSSDITNKITTHNEVGGYVLVGSSKATIEEFRQEIAGSVLEYETIEETIEEYTEEQQTAHNQLQNAKTYKTVTNVFTENAEVEMEYVAHTKTYIDNKVNNMQNQLNTINELLSTTNTSALLLNNLQTDLESEVL